MSIERYILQNILHNDDEFCFQAMDWWSYESDRYTCLTKISMAQGLQKIANQIQCELLSTLLICYLLLYIKQYHLHYILIFNIATKCLDITYHFLLRYDLLL